MRKFKSGDRIKCVNSKDWDHFEIGDEVEVLEVLTSSYFVSNKVYVSFKFEDDFELVEDRTNWHPHADVIIAWAKGEKIQGRCVRDRWTNFVMPHNEATPSFHDYSEDSALRGARRFIKAIVEKYGA